MNYKVSILAAGLGSRMGEFCDNLNKVLIPIKGKPTICHIIEYFPENIEIVIAVGYKKESLVSYLKTAYPNRKLTFVEVTPYVGEGSGPGYSLYCCKSHLQCPFIHTAGDTLVREKIPEPSSNWLGVAEVPDTSRFISVKIENETVTKIDSFIKTDNKHAYIGLAGIYDYESFWNATKENKETVNGEIQVSNGLHRLKDAGLKSKTFNWFDTGTLSSYEYAQKNYPNGKGYQGE